MSLSMISYPTNPRVIAPGAGSSIDRSIDTIALSIKCDITSRAKKATNACVTAILYRCVRGSRDLGTYL